MNKQEEKLRTELDIIDFRLKILFTEKIPALEKRQEELNKKLNSIIHLLLENKVLTRENLEDEKVTSL